MNANVVKLLAGMVTAFFAVFYATGTLALDLTSLLKSGLEFEIKLKTDEALLRSRKQTQRLTEALIEEIQKQRKNNITLREVDDERRILRTEIRLLESKLRSLGFLQNKVSGQLIETPVKISALKARQLTEKHGTRRHTPEIKFSAVYAIDTGPLYRIDSVSIALHPDIDASQIKSSLIGPGDPLVAEDVFRAIDEIRQTVLADYCFFKVDIDYRVAVSHVSQKATVFFNMADSTQVQVGKVSVEGVTTLDNDFLTQKLKIRQGDCFKPAAVERGRLDLLRSNLLARVVAEVGSPDQGKVDIIYKVIERRHRTVSAGIGYSTDEDFNVSAGWEHRNIFDSGEKFDVEAKFSKQTTTLEGGLEFPNFFTEDVSLSVSGEGQIVDRVSYDAKSVEAGAEIQYYLNPRLSFSIGSDVKYSDVRDGLSETEFYLVSFPVQSTWDTTDDLLDPRKGWVLFGEIRPYTDIVNANTEFVKSTVSASFYHTFTGWLSPTLALRLATGNIRGEPTASIPADERFYSGGGGSVRGYPFQSLSQEVLDDDGELIRLGGSSFQELSTEFRFRLNEDWGIVVFADGGYAFGETSPEFDERLFWGAGLGLRYYTLVAPLRLDLALPIDRRDSDDSYQLYISLGQAF